MRTGKSQLLLGFVSLSMLLLLIACSSRESSQSTPDIPATVVLAVREVLPTPEPTPNIPATVAVAVQEALPTPGPTPNIAATVAVAVEETLTASTPTRDPTPTVTVANQGIFSSATPHILPPPTPHILPSATPGIAVWIPQTGEVIRLYSAPPRVIHNSDSTGVRYLAEIQTNLGNFTVELFPLDAPVAMANAGPDTNGSQFFITVASARHLTGNHTIFGQVIKGQHIVDAISLVPTDGLDRPLDDVEISKILLTESREEK